MTLPSTAGWGRLKAILEIAPAV
jgi:hypothetical protein